VPTRHFIAALQAHDQRSWKITPSPSRFIYIHYNFCQIRKTLRVTPAMAAGVTDRRWEIRDGVNVLEDWKNNTRLVTPSSPS
jgi:hypothetical protein